LKQEEQEKHAGEDKPEPAADTTSQAEELPTHIDIKQTATGGISTTYENRTLDWRQRPHTDRVFGSVVGQNRFFDQEQNQDPEQAIQKSPAAVGTADINDNPTKDTFMPQTFTPADPAGTAQDHAFLRGEVLGDLETPSTWDPDFGGDRHMQSFTVNEERSWTAEQTWGFERIGDAAAAGGGGGGAGKGVVKGEAEPTAEAAPRYYSRRVVVRKTDGSGEVQRVRLVYDYKGE
jgi:hypothetical protein